MIGQSLSQYKITAELGRGGMGIVYRATDTKLNRDVAIKVLPAAALASEDDRARFFREAQAAAQLHHPNIATVFQIDEAIALDENGTEVNASDGPRPFIAMEFIEGQTLHEYVADAPMKLTEAVQVGIQVAEALKAAHAKDIVHRDIKSANVMLTADGVAKVLDFGLAKTNQSTMLTRMGSTLGTVAYMSPEQARGQEVDGRTDLYSLGSMLYEMIVGKVPFEGEYEQAVVYSILNENPDPLTSRRTGVPMELERIVSKLMSKDADYRYQTAADLIADLKTVDLSQSGLSRTSLATTAVTSEPVTTNVSKSPQLWKWAVLVFMGAILASLGWFVGSSSDSSAESYTTLPVALPSEPFYGFPTASPDGRYWAMAFSHPQDLAEIRIWDLQTNTITAIPGSKGYILPKFSPNGEWVAFSDNEAIARARVPGGSALPVDSAANFLWLDDDKILVSKGADLETSVISTLTTERTSIDWELHDSIYVEFFDMQRVPGTNTILTSGRRGDQSHDILALNMDDNSVSVMLAGACCGYPLKGDRLLFLTGETIKQYNPEGTLVAQRYDRNTMEVRGFPVDLSPDPVVAFEMGVGAGDLLFRLPGSGLFTGRYGISWFDPSTDQREALGFPLADYDRISISPTGTKAAVEKNVTGTSDSGRNIYILDLETGIEQRLTNNGKINRFPQWTHSGKVYYMSGAINSGDIVAKRADGSGEEELIVSGAEALSVSRDEKWIAYIDRTSGHHLYAKNLETGDVIALDTTSFKSSDVAFSPNGKFLAYSRSVDGGSSSPTSDQRVFVRSFPGDEFHRQLADEYADDPVWSADGSRLYFNTRTAMKAVDVSSEQQFQILSSPEVILPAMFNYRMDVHPTDGRILLRHDGAVVQGDGGSTMLVTFGLSAYLDELMGDAN